MPTTTEVQSRMWYDGRQRMWVLCDGCDGPTDYDLAFFADSTSHAPLGEPGLTYCHLCARDLLSAWWLKLAARSAWIATKVGK